MLWKVLVDIKVCDGTTLSAVQITRMKLNEGNLLLITECANDSKLGMTLSCGVAQNYWNRKTFETKNLHRGKNWNSN